jgi:hypothetical protein
VCVKESHQTCPSDCGRLSPNHSGWGLPRNTRIVWSQHNILELSQTVNCTCELWTAMCLSQSNICYMCSIASNISPEY